MNKKIKKITYKINIIKRNNDAEIAEKNQPIPNYNENENEDQISKNDVPTVQLQSESKSKSKSPINNHRNVQFDPVPFNFKMIEILSNNSNNYQQYQNHSIQQFIPKQQRNQILKIDDYLDTSFIENQQGYLTTICKNFMQFQQFNAFKREI